MKYKIRQFAILIATFLCSIALCRGQVSVGGPVTAESGGFADGSIVTLGAKADDKSAATDTTPITMMQILKEISYMEQNPASRAVTGTFWQATQPVSGTFWQATQPTSIADGSDVTLGAKADAKSTATDATAVSIMQVLKEISYMEQNPASRAVTGTFWQATQPISAASLPLPSGASTEASLAKLTIASGTAAGSNTFAMAGGSATTAAPTTTNGNLYPLSMDTHGAIRVITMGNDGSAPPLDSVVDSVLNSGENPILVGGEYEATPTVLETDHDKASFHFDVNQNLKTVLQAGNNNIGDVDVASIAAGSNIIGKVTTDQTTHGTTDLVAADVTKLAGVTLAADPCTTDAISYVAINQVADTQLVAIDGTKVVYVCGMTAVVQAAEILNVVKGTGSVCATGKAAIVGSTTDSEGVSFAANGGFAWPVTGKTYFKTAAGDALCLTESGTNRTSGILQYVQK